MFRNREDAAYQLAAQLKDRELVDPLVLAIPRGGVVTGAVLAEELSAEFDVVLSRKLRAPHQPELAVGAISEDGRVYVNHHAREVPDLTDEYIVEECRHQLDEIARRKKLIRGVRPEAPISGRSVIVTDDGIATGSTMIAALQVVKAQKPRELIVAVPVASPDRLLEVRRGCDEVVCLLSPDNFWAIGQFYEDFSPVEDAQVIELLRHAPLPKTGRACQRRRHISFHNHFALRARSCQGKTRNTSLTSVAISAKALTKWGSRMSNKGIAAFDSTLQTTNVWLHDLMDLLDWNDKHRAYHALSVVLHTLRDRLSVDQAAALGAQLPMLVRGVYYEGWHPGGKPTKQRHVGDFLAPVLMAFQDDLEVNPEEIARAVFQVIAKHVSPGEIKHLKLSLPSEIRSLWSPETHAAWF